MDTYPEYYPDDNKTRIYYENIMDDLEIACDERNIPRINYIIEKLRANDMSSLNTIYLYCVLHKVYDIAIYLDNKYHLSRDAKRYTIELCVNSSINKYDLHHDLCEYQIQSNNYRLASSDLAQLTAKQQHRLHKIKMRNILPQI